MLRNLGRQLWRSVGSCGYCIRKSFQLAALFWAIALALFAAGATQPLLVGAGAIATALTLLWIAHILAFAAKKTARAPLAAKARGVTSRSMSRRDLAPVFGKAIVAIVVVSAVPAFAQTDGCNCMTCMGPHDCCSNPTGIGCSCGYQYNVACQWCC